MPDRLLLKLALLAGAFGLTLASSAANAQDYGPPPGYQGGPTEEVPVIAPRFHGDSMKVNGPLEKVSLSTAVRYDDLDLRTRRGAWELRMRVHDAAQDMCFRLAQVYGYEQANGTSCYKTALQDALLHANEAIDDARISYRLYRD